MRHTIIGKGNLGSDLYLELKGLGHDVEMLSRSNGFDFPCDLRPVLHTLPDVVWCTIGHGSIDEAKSDFVGAIALHTHLPQMLLRGLPEGVGLVLFSSDYVAHPVHNRDASQQNHRPKSLYELSKAWMEQLVKFHGRRNTWAVRVGSLYGGTKPEKTFPGKLRRRFSSPCRVELPCNRVSPTSTLYVAKVLSSKVEQLMDSKAEIHSVAPANTCTLVEWGQVILGDRYEVVSKGLDPERPMISNIRCSLGGSVVWEQLWESSRFYFDRNFC